MASQHDKITAAGARLVAISVDSPQRNAAMIQKLRLPFSLLSDPDGEAVIKPLGLWNSESEIALPAVIVIGTEGEEAFRQVSRDFADRLAEEELVEVVQDLGLEAVDQPPPALGDAEPGPKAMPVEKMSPYFRGARFAVKALQMRIPQAQDEAERYIDELERYLAATQTLRS